jgi:hypothetical protein
MGTGWDGEPPLGGEVGIDALESREGALRRSLQGRDRGEDDQGHGKEIQGILQKRADRTRPPWTS